MSVYDSVYVYNKMRMPGLKGVELVWPIYHIFFTFKILFKKMKIIIIVIKKHFKFVLQFFYKYI